VTTRADAPRPATGGFAPEALASIEDFADLGVRAFTTTRAAGTFGTSGDEPVRVVMDRWARLRAELGVGRLATAGQVHEARVIVHDGDWQGWLRVDAADGHVAPGRGTALAVTVADCVPVLLAHPSGAVAALHSGWRGTELNIASEGVRHLARHGAPARELRAHLGPAICGRCYEVSPEVHARLTGRIVAGPTPVDLRALIADQLRALGVRRIAVSESCTRCDQERFFSHRGGDAGRQLAVIVAPRRDGNEGAER
jgi:YfiH family protein